MPFGQARVVEVVGRLVAQAEPLHHAARAEVRGNGERDDFAQPEALEPETQGRARGLDRVAPAPVLGGESPGDFDAGGEGRFEARHAQPHHAEEGRHVGAFERPQAEAVAIEVLADAGSQGIALGARERPRQVLEHPRVDVEGGEGGEIALAPGA